MMAVLLFLSFLLIVCLILSPYILIRNDKVYSFRREYIEKAFDYLQKRLNSCETKQDYDEYKKLRDKVLNTVEKYTYEKMLFSFKPLKLEYWFTEEEIEYLNYGSNR